MDDEIWIFVKRAGWQYGVKVPITQLEQMQNQGGAFSELIASRVRSALTVGDNKMKPHG